MRRLTTLTFALAVLLPGAGPSARAQEVTDVWPRIAPGSEHWTQKETTYANTPVGTVVINVVTPTLTAYLPPAAEANGTALVIAPGGGFVALATSLEGTDLARWCQQHGIAAFLLKYRTIEKKQDGIPQMDQDTAARYGIADAIQALRVVRQHAREWRISPNRVGIIGFSAGGMVASGALLQPDSGGRPNFAAMVYGAPFGVMPKIPGALPPVFLAWAQDDPISERFLPRFEQALVAAGNKPEVHVFSAGGHGFGMKAQGTTSDHWIDEFGYWLAAKGFAK